MRILLPASLCVISLAASAVPASAANLALRRAHTCADVARAGQAAAVRPGVPFRADGLWYSGLQLTPRSPLTAPPATDWSPAKGAVAPGSVVNEAAGTSRSGAEAATSTTNVQEVGVDEPDLVKVVGDRAYAVVGTQLWVIDVSTSTPQRLSTLDLGGVGGQLLIRGNRLLFLGPDPVRQRGALGSTERRVADVAVDAGYLPSASTSRLLEVRIDDPAHPQITRTMKVPGIIVDARLTGGTVRVVVNSTADLPAPTLDGGPAMETSVVSRALPPSKARRLSVRHFIRRTTLHSRVTKRTFKRRLVSCNDVQLPSAAEGTDLLSVLSIDLDHGLFNVDRDAVLGSAQAVYASQGSLYIVTSKEADAVDPEDVPAGTVSEIHQFDTTKPGETSYVASGSVPGFILNKYALSEQDGVLRVATTTGPPWFTTDASESSITTLKASGSGLRRLGHVGGIGKGERIFAVRFAGDAAYVVTFKQTDPFFTVDLRIPSAPKVAGELKLPGVSTYLHAVGDDLVLGVGEDGAAANASLFDVRDLAAPKLLIRRTLASQGNSPVSYDPHAFLFWPATATAFVPVTAWAPDNSSEYPDEHLTGLRTTRAAPLATVGEVREGPTFDRAQIVRSAVVGDRLLTFSDFGVRASTLTDLAPLGFLPWTTN